MKSHDPTIELRLTLLNAYCDYIRLITAVWFSSDNDIECDARIVYIASKISDGLTLCAIIDL